MRSIVRMVREYAWLVLLAVFCLAKGIAASASCPPAHKSHAVLSGKEPDPFGYALVMKLLDGAGRCTASFEKGPLPPADARR